MLKHALLACLPRLLPTNFSATRLTWTGKLYRAMDQLERLQRRRRGENVPPPCHHQFG